MVYGAGGIPPNANVNPLLLVICLVLVALQFGLPRKWAFLPLLIAACHTPYVPFLGGLTVTRVVILAGLVRAASNGWLKWSPRNSLDLLVAMFAALALLSTVGHAWQPYNPLVARMRLALDVGGTFLFARAYLAEHDMLERLAVGLAIVLLSFALIMLVEKQTGLNPYRFIGARNEISLVRDGKIRAQGPFGTPILAGTVGASAIPLFFPLWRKRRGAAITGLTASVLIVLTSASSGPIGTAMIGIGGVVFWRWRNQLKAFLIAAVIGLTVLHFIKNRPIWYLMALMDFVGGSTGWHRAYLIDMAIKHLDEWWLYGSDFTRHWMPYGLAAVPEHCDLTNYYIQLGVMGGLPLMFGLVLIQWRSFKEMGATFRVVGGTGSETEFRLWCLGAALFSHAVTFLSISYFDQMYVFFWSLLGGLTGFLTASHAEEDEDVEEMPEEPGPLEWGKGQAKSRIDVTGTGPR